MKDYLISIGFKQTDENGDFWSCSLELDNGYEIEINSAERLWVCHDHGGDDCILLKDFTDKKKLNHLIEGFK